MEMDIMGRIKYELDGKTVIFWVPKRWQSNSHLLSYSSLGRASSVALVNSMSSSAAGVEDRHSVREIKGRAASWQENTLYDKA